MAVCIRPIYVLSTECVRMNLEIVVDLCVDVCKCVSVCADATVPRLTGAIHQLCLLYAFYVGDDFRVLLPSTVRIFFFFLFLGLFLFVCSFHF